MILIKEPENIEGKVVSGWALDIDPMNYILVRIGIVTSKDSKNFGSKTFRNEKFYPSLDALVKGMLNILVLESSVGSLEEIKTLLNDRSKEIVQALAKNIVLNRKI